MTVASMPAGPATSAERAPYLEALEAHVRTRPVRLNVPGHKGGAFADDRASRALAAAFELDIPPLVHGLDIGSKPTPYEAAQMLAAEAWGARRTWFLVNGASHANHAACLALARRGDTVIVQRNVHSSVVDGLIVTGLRPRFIAPELDPRLGIAHCVTPAALREALADTPGVAGVIVTSPTYFGMCADVPGLVEAAHDYGVPIVVDEAWGAHLAFHERLPADALSAGADLVVSSTHKMLGSLTQSAMLHLGKASMLAEEEVERAVTLLESTSRSALLAASLDAARRRAAVAGRTLIDATLQAIPEIHQRLRELPGVDPLDQRTIGRHGIADVDPLRLAITVARTGLGGNAIALAARERRNVFVELVAPRVLVAVLAVGETTLGIEPMIEALRHALRRAAGGQANGTRDAGPAPTFGRLALSPREAFFAAHDRIPLARAAGRVAAETLAVYPPGIPAVIAGEVLTPAGVQYLRSTVERGSVIRGCSDPTLKTVLVIRQPEPCRPTVTTP